MAATWGTSTLLDAPIDVVWDFLTSDTNDANWRGPWLRSVRQLTPGPFAVGTQYESRYRFFGRDETVVTELIEIVPGQRLAWCQVGDGSLAVNDGRYDLEAVDGRTRFTVSGTIEGHGVRRIIDAPFAAYLNRAARQQHAQLVAALRDREPA
jgi:uncharacterized protein YndB with AHSA1/START domain